MGAVVDLGDKIRKIAGRPYTPVEVARVNDQVVRMGLIEGEYHWHRHSAEDELFYVYSGEIEIQYRDRPNARIRQGQVHVVPKGVEHCTRSIVPSYILLFEPNKVNTRGD